MASTWILYAILFLILTVTVGMYFSNKKRQSLSMFDIGDSLCDETGEVFHIIGLPNNYNLGPDFKRAYVYRRMDGRTFVLDQDLMEDGRFRILNSRHKRA